MTIAEKITRAKADYDAVYEAGKQAGGGDNYYDTFWDLYLQNGERTKFDYAFAGAGWTDDTFKPNRNISVVSSSYMFHSSKIKNLKALTETLGIVIDFSKCTGFTYTFGACEITDIGIVDVRSSVGSIQYFAYNNKMLVNFEKLIINENTAFSKTAFQGTDKLEEIRIEGTLGTNGFDVHWSTKLSKASITSIINCLSTTTSGLSITLAKTAVNNAFETADGLADGSNSEEWLALIATRQNWTITLA